MCCLELATDNIIKRINFISVIVSNLIARLTTMIMENSSTSDLLSTTEDYEKAVNFRYFGISVALFVILVGPTGNLLTILAYISNKKLQTTFNVLVVNLSVVDFITSALMLPFNLAGYVKMQWPFGNDSFTTRLQAFFYFYCGYTSVVFLVAITMNRFIGVFWPIQYKTLFRRRRIIFTLVFCWTFPAICLLPFLVGSDPQCSTPNHALTGFNKEQFVCTFICLPQNGWDSYMQWTRVTFQFLPLALMIVTYTAVLWKIKKSSDKRYGMMLKKNGCTPTTGSANTTTAAVTLNSRANSLQDTNYLSIPTEVTPRPSIDENQKKIHNNRRLVLISVVICIAFMITFLPSVIINIIPGREKFDTRIHMMASNLSWFNSALNPIIYVILNKRFRKEYIRLLKMICGRVAGGFYHEGNSRTTNHKVYSKSTSPNMQKKSAITKINY